jgi:predicted RNA-binding Zn ribbon-like protein
MKENSEVAKFYRQKDQQRKARAKRPVAEKLAVATKLRDVQQKLAPARVANKAKRAAGKIEIRIKTA